MRAEGLVQLCARARIALNGFEIWYVSMNAADRALAGEHPWVDYLEGRNPAYPVTALRASLERVRARVALVHADTSTPETRLADNALEYNPASVASLLQLTQGALHIARPPWSPTSPHQGGAPLHARLRYFDPVRRRAGLPEDVAALVDTLDAARTGVTLVNLESKPRTRRHGSGWRVWRACDFVGARRTASPTP